MIKLKNENVEVIQFKPNLSCITKIVNKLGYIPEINGHTDDFYTSIPSKYVLTLQFGLKVKENDYIVFLPDKLKGEEIMVFTKNEFEKLFVLEEE